jgi:hypothetical protein
VQLSAALTSGSEGEIMASPKFIEIDGKRFVWRDLFQRRREQLAAARTEQPALFELKRDCKPMPARTAAGRHREPSLFSLTGRECWRSPAMREEATRGLFQGVAHIEMMSHESEIAPVRETLRRQIADDHGFALYRHYSERDAAAFLRLHTVTLKKIRLAGAIGYISKGRRAVAYFGFQIADYLIDQVRPCRATPSTVSRSANGGFPSGAGVPPGVPPSMSRQPSARDGSALARTILSRPANAPRTLPRRAPAAERAGGGRRPRRYRARLLQGAWRTDAQRRQHQD